MKILLVITEAPPITSGVARVAHELSSRLRARGHQVDILSSLDIPRLELGEVRLSSMLWRGYKQIYDQAPTYDIVHLHGPAPTFSELGLLYALFARQGHHPRVVYTHHCEIAIPGQELLCGIYNTAHRLISRMVDHVVTSTPSYARMLERFIPAQKISTIPWGVNSGPEVSAKPAGLNVLYVGQLRPYKGLDVLLRAAHLVPEATITVIGGGHQEQFYQQMADSLGLRNVCFLGRASDEEVQRAYAQAHALVLPSLTRAEAFGLVLLEGMAASCVPIASQLTGLTDVVDDTGFTFLPGDEAGLAAALQQLLDNPVRTAELGVEARRRAEQFSWDYCAAAYERLFLDLLSHGVGMAVDWFPRVISLEAQVMQSMLATEQIMEQLFEPALARFLPSRASVLLRLPLEDKLMIVAQQGLDSILLGARLNARSSVAGWVTLNRQPVVISPEYLPEPLRPYLRNSKLVSSLSIPIMYKNQVIAVLNLARDDQEVKQHYTPDDLRELMAWAPSAVRTRRLHVGLTPRMAV